MAISAEDRAKAKAVREAVKGTLIGLNLIDAKDWKARNWRLVPSRSTPQGFGHGFPAWRLTLKQIAKKISQDPRYDVKVNAVDTQKTLDVLLRETRILLIKKL